MVIPANKVHLAEPARADGHRHRRQHARSTPTSATRPSPADIDGELEKLHTAVHFGADTVMDLSTGSDIDAHPPGDHRRLARADRHGADLPDARRARRRHRRHDAAALSRHGRAPGEAGRRLHDGPLRRPARAPAPDDGPRHRHRQPRRLADRQVDDGPPPAEPALHALRRPVRHHARVRRHLEPGRRPAARLDRRRQRRRPVRRARRPGRADPPRPGRTARR